MYKREEDVVHPRYTRLDRERKPCLEGTVAGKARLRASLRVRAIPYWDIFMTNIFTADVVDLVATLYPPSVPLVLAKKNLHVRRIHHGKWRKQESGRKRLFITDEIPRLTETLRNACDCVFVTVTLLRRDR